MKKIVGFGDSFVFGTEQKNNHNGSLGWPARAAKKLGTDYETLAVPGCGNDHIARQIYSYFASHSVTDTLAVINWTWMCRWDFYIADHDTWITLGPTCVPKKLQHLVDQTQSQRLVDFYQDYANSSLLWNKFRNLQTIYAAQCFLKQHNIRAVQTFMDYEMFDQQFHAPDYVIQLQSLVQPNLQNFENQNFLDWSRSRGYEVTDLGWHPLEQAHEAASELWMHKYKELLYS